MLVFHQYVADLKEKGRVRFEAATDREVLEASH
jgi:hypothetical protein